MLLQTPFALEPPEECHDEQQSTAGTHHHAEGPIDEEHGRHEIFDLLDVAVAKIGFVLFERLASFGSLLRVGVASGTIGFEGFECFLSLLHLLSGG